MLILAFTLRSALLEEKAIPAFAEFLRGHINFNLDHYHLPSAKRRLKRMLIHFNVQSLPELADFLRNKPQPRPLFIGHFVVRVTQMFREPAANRVMIRRLFPIWAQKKQLNIWLSGCSTGAEVLSLCILLKEHNLLHKARILASDLDAQSLRMARQGRIPVEQIPAAKAAYQASGGQVFLEEYYTQVGPECFFHEDLLQNVRFEERDLFNSPPIERFDLVWCKNVLIYFQPEAHYRAQSILVRSLKPDGYLMVGEKEALSNADERCKLAPVSAEHRIYRMSVPALRPL